MENQPKLHHHLEKPYSEVELGEIDDCRHPDPSQRCPSRSCNKVNCRKPWHRPYSKTNVVEKMKPLLLFTGWSKVVFGSVLVVVVLSYAEEFDTLYGTEKSKMISFLSFGGLIALAVSGMVLLISVLLDKRSLMWFYVIASTFLCIYIFGLSVVMLQYGLYNAPVLRIKEKLSATPPSGHETNQSKTGSPHLTSGLRDIYIIHRFNNFMFGKAFLIGAVTLLGSVMHFVGTVTVFTYYNLKYIHPMLFYCHQFS